MSFQYFDNNRLNIIKNEIINSPLGYDAEIRSNLFSGINRKFRADIPVSSRINTQIGHDLTYLNSVERLTDGTVPFQLWLNNASIEYDSYPTVHKVLQEALADVVAQATKMSPMQKPPAPSDMAFARVVKEKSVIRNDMLSFGFLERGVEVGSSVARLLVARYDNGMLTKLSNNEPKIYLGTGWLLTSELLITNHHVINARGGFEPNASETDFHLQAENTIVQFDYDDENMEGTKMKVLKLEASSEELDYAIVRLENLSPKKPLTISSKKIEIKKDEPQVVNIIQHPFGKPKKVAIRNNHIYDSEYPKVRYFTDTEGGSSGSPVFNDNWQVVALHRAYSLVENVKYNGQTTAWVNEGVQLEAIYHDIKANYIALASEIGIS